MAIELCGQQDGGQAVVVALSPGAELDDVDGELEVVGGARDGGVEAIGEKSGVHTDNRAAQKQAALSIARTRSCDQSLALQRRVAYPARPARPLPSSTIEAGSGTKSSSHGSRQIMPKLGGL